ncbi:MAG: DUF1993 domain-containing protein [Hyphomonadaceae bacterium]|nr:DUF1993 domain-containing protein [Hyphomonadaceae bacterium]
MTQNALYAASGPVFASMLNNLAALLDKAEAHATAKKFDVEVLSQSRLSPDMFPLTFQVGLATAFAKNAMCRLAGQTPPDFENTDTTFPLMRARIRKTLDIVHNITEADFAGADTREISFNVGPDKKITCKGGDYLNHFALPNFYFHMTAAYAILRHNGVDIGKRDFTGDPAQLAR